MIGWALDNALDWILDNVRDALNLVWTFLASTLFHVPDVTSLPQVQTLATRSLLVVNTGYVLVIIVTGIVVMAHGSVQIRYGAGELIPRLVLGLAAANFATPICVAIIGAANVLVQALTGQGITTTDNLQQLLGVLTHQLENPVALLLTVVIGLILVVLVLMLVVGWIIRWIFLILLCGIAPAALACHGTPWSEGIALIWWRSMGGIGLTVVLQAVTLNTALMFLLDPATDLSILGFQDTSGLLTLLIVVVLLWVTVRIPSLIRAYLSQAGSRHNILGALVRLVIAQQVTRGLSRALYSSTSGRVTGAGRAPGGIRGAHRDPQVGRHARRRSTPSGRRLLYAFPPPPIPVENSGPRQRDGESARDFAKRRRAAWLSTRSPRPERTGPTVSEFDKWWRTTWLRPRTRHATTRAPSSQGPGPRTGPGTPPPLPPAAPDRSRSPRPRQARTRIPEGVTPRTVFVDRTTPPPTPARRTPPRHRRNP
jgi:hypothetical protein